MKKPPADGTLNLRAADFDLVAADLRDRMVAWARVLVHRFSEMGVEVEATWSDEQPIAQKEKKKSSVRILFYAPLRKHACLAFRLGARAVEVSVEIYPSVHARAVADELARSLDRLPDQFCLGSLAGDHRIAAREATSADVQELLEGDGGLWIGWSVPREVALTHSALVGEQLGDALVALAQVFAEVVEPALPRQRPGLQPRGKRTAVKTVKTKRVNGVKTPIDRGAKVLVLAGPFVGKEGVVQELDGRGAAKVMLGLLATRLDVTDLAIAGDGKSRPVLSSSHRKPLAAR